MQSTIYIEPKDEDADIDEEASEGFSAWLCAREKDMDAITKINLKPNTSTHSRALRRSRWNRRADKEVPGSMEISREVGAALLREPHFRRRAQPDHGAWKFASVYPWRRPAQAAFGGHGRQGGILISGGLDSPVAVDDGKARRGADGHSLCEPAVHERART